MTDTAHYPRRMLGAVLLMGMLGVGAELVLIEHDEGWQQQVPLATLALGLLALGWETFAPGRRSWSCLRLAMLGLAVSGIAGLYLHYTSNEEFQRELHPSLHGWRLSLATMRAHSPPSLGPGILMLLGAIGWIASHGRRPAAPPRDDSTT